MAQRAMIGRSAELRLLSGRRSGPGRAFVVEATAGMGKTTLVTAVIERARAEGVEVLQCSGSERQMSSGFTALHELLHPVLAQAAMLPTRQEQALLGAFGLQEGNSPDPLLINLAALGLLEEAASRTPLLVVIEDLHWLDASSATVLDFVARRVGNSPIVLVATVRPGHEPAGPFGGPDATRVPLSRLSEEDAALLLEQVAPGLPERSRRRVLSEADGNPLAVREFATEVVARDGAPALAGRLPTTRRLEAAFVGDLAALPERSRTLLLLAAAGDDSAGLAELLAAGAELGITVADIEPLERVRLVSVGQNRLVFFHPLVRSAVYGAASTSERAQAHRLLGAVATDPVRATWHRAAGVLERDEPVAAALEEAAGVAQRRGALPDAFAALRRAADLSPDPDDAVHRLALAAETARQAGLVEETGSILAEIIPLVRRPADVMLTAVVESMFGLTTGAPMRTPDDLIVLADRLEAPTPEERLLQRTRILVTATGRAWALGTDAGAKERLRQAAAQLLTEAQDWPQQVAMIMVDPASVAPAVRPLLPAVLPAVLDAAFVEGREREPGTNQWVQMIGRAAESLHDLDTARAALEEWLRYQRTQGTVADEATAMHARALLRIFAGDLTAALADAEQSYELGLATGAPRSAAAAATASALVLAFRGEPARVAEQIRTAQELTNHQPHALITAPGRWAAGLVAMAEGRPADAWFEMTQMAVFPTVALWGVADLAEAGVRSGHEEEARAVVAEAEEQARAFDAPFVWALVHRARALLTEGDAAEEHHAASLESARKSGEQFEVGRSELAFGEWLRRRRRIVQAREHLDAALRIFEASGARALTERTVAELRAAGVARRTATAAEPVDATAGLTPQERAVVQLAASGLSNKEIADQVYLSHRTVAAHLYKAFPKLGVSNRSQLVDLLRNSGART